MQVTSKVLHVLASVIVLVLLLIVVPATPALALTFEVTPSSGTPGSTVTITGTGFTINQTIYIFFNQTLVQAAQVTAQATFTATFPIPATATPGTTAVVSVQHTTFAYDPVYQIAITSFRVTQADVAVSPASAMVGETVTVTGAGFTLGTNASITFDGTTIVPAVAVEANGTFTTTLDVPVSYGGSNHQIKATDTNNRSDTATFAILPSITIDPTSGKAGDMVTVDGTGFSASKAITITCDDAEVVTAQTPLNTESNGSFNTSFEVPAIASDTHEIKASDGTYSSSADFTTSATFNIGETEGYVGDEVEVSGDGFAAEQTVLINFDTELVKTFLTDDTGSFSGTFDVPALVSDTYTVIASDDVNTATAEFTVLVLVGADLSQTIGSVGTELTISGVGFSGQVTIKYDDVRITTVTAEDDGTFTATFDVPASEGGDHLITASDGTNTVESVFVMESEAPLTPALTLPPIDSKSEGEASFDWEDVSDPSGVTYIFQLATDEDFTQSSILLEKTGLTDSGYALTQDEKLESTKEEAPYYWRVKAVDDAGNESDWSTPSSFYVGFSLTLPDWARYAIIGAAVVLAGFIGFLIGRRSAYFSP